MVNAASGWPASLERALAHCLGEMARTGDVEVSLRRYPQYSDYLRPLLEVAQATHRYYAPVPEAPGGLKAGRERLLTAAAQQRVRRGVADAGVSSLAAGRPAAGRSARQLRYRGIRLAFAMRLVSVLLAVVIGATAIGSGVVWAAGNELPGDLLYPVKMVIEDTRLALASAPQDQVDLALRFFGERGEEIQRMVKAERQVPDAVITRMERHLERALVQAAWVPAEKMEEVLRRIAQRTRVQAEILTLERELRESGGSQQFQAVLEQAVAVCERGTEAAEYGLREPQAFRNRYRYQNGMAEPTERPGQATAPPGQGHEDDPERHQWRYQERAGTPAGAPHVTPSVTQTVPGLKATLYVPWATARPHMVPEGPGTTPGPRSTSQGSRATPETQPKSQGPQATSAPQATPAAPQPKPQSTPEKPPAIAEPQPTPPDPPAAREPQPTPQRPQATPKPQTTPRGQ